MRPTGLFDPTDRPLPSQRISNSKEMLHEEEYFFFCFRGGGGTRLFVIYTGYLVLLGWYNEGSFGLGNAFDEVRHVMHSEFMQRKLAEKVPWNIEMTRG
jgi:hypothetical protein